MNEFITDAETSNPNIRQITVKEGATLWATQFTLIREDGSTLHVTSGTRVYMSKIFYAKKRAHQTTQDPLTFIGHR